MGLIQRPVHQRHGLDTGLGKNARNPFLGLHGHQVHPLGDLPVSGHLLGRIAAIAPMLVERAGAGSLRA